MLSRMTASWKKRASAGPSGSGGRARPAEAAQLA
jgi:hypothetical protein